MPRKNGLAVFQPTAKDAIDRFRLGMIHTMLFLSPSLRYTKLSHGSLALILACLLVGVAHAQRQPGPFTHAPRDIRSRAIDQQHVRLTLAMDCDNRRVDGTAFHRLQLLSSQSEISLDAVNMKITKVATANEAGEAQQDLSFRHEGGTLHISLGRTAAAEETLRLLIQYQLDKPSGGVHFVHPESHEPASLKMVWTQSEPEFARHWIPCIDSPIDRLTSETITTVPKDWVVLSNGILKNKTENANGTQTWHWQQSQSHVPYLISIAAGQFEVYEQAWDGIPVMSYVPTGRLADAPRSFQNTAKMLEYFSKQIGYRYPWPKYAQICVDEYNWGGMEHTSATTLNLNTLHNERDHLDFSSENLVAHELAHQWWGDLVTCKDWGELWLNESFATYFATLWTEHHEGWDKAAISRLREAKSYLGEDQRYRRSIVNFRYDRPESMFDSHSYPKGARVLHALRNEVGDELFWKSIRHYIEVNQFRTVETADLRIAFEETTGRALGWFFDQWVYHGGHPEFTVSWTWDPDTKHVRINVKQTQKVDSLTSLFRVSVDIAVATPGEPEQIQIHRIKLTDADETFQFPAATRPSRVCFDPKDWVLKTLTFAKPLEELANQLQKDPSVICRLQAIEGLEALEDATSKSLLLTAAKSDKDLYVREAAVQALAKRNGDDVRDLLLSVLKEDPSSIVRTKAASTLQKFAGDVVTNAIRERLPQEQSYQAIAAMLRTLVKLTPDKPSDVLVAHLAIPCRDEAVLRAAIDGLIEVKSPDALELFQKHLEGAAAERKALFLGGIARLKPRDKPAIEPLIQALQSPRRAVRSVAISTLVALQDPQYIAPLQDARHRESLPALTREIDDAIAKLQGFKNSTDPIKSQLDELRKENEQLKKRLEGVEAKQADK